MRRGRLGSGLITSNSHTDIRTNVPVGWFVVANMTCIVYGLYAALQGQGSIHLAPLQSTGDEPRVNAAASAVSRMSCPRDDA
jgi:hypothetical protein